ncbi:helix-turn-helix transcriptional regulator [Aggregatimonas sangjinii]|uniref:Helix-turn-helix transcriptional regulator n=1 Tax=Aggregatimonas sangjinii TaxID=2583587 RepID=A0A5B7ST03_9FLAO|nr:helix-turn-helix transcriptional regulator [Aggregatimonas sangjinii]QCW99793.1 helix-turn-helix transcriptional regulator [Aggregatimonas sangjinii]
MVNSAEFIRRLEKLLDYYGISAAVFADKIQVQRSSISHLLSGRNKPSLDFVLKVVKTFPEVNLYWLLNGKGTFPTTEENTSLSLPTKAKEDFEPTGKVLSQEKSIEKIVIFYSDGTFKSFRDA